MTTKKQDSTLAAIILDFFNTVDDPFVLRERIGDDPNFSTSSASGYGINLTLASRILVQ